jgi:hypothetical protein
MNTKIIFKKGNKKMIKLEIGYKAGYPGKDSMRTKAEKMFGEAEMREARSFRSPESKTPASKPLRRPFAEGGAVPMANGGFFDEGGDIAMARGGRFRNKEDHCKRSKFAMGGVAKIRLGQMTPSGKPIAKRGSRTLKDTF